MPDDLLKEYRELADLGGNFRGLTLLEHAKQIGKVVKRHGAKTLLDYGSGAGDAYRDPHKVHERWGVTRMRIRLYDPSFKKIDRPVAEHERFDGVICSDVLEHVPEDQLDALVAKLFLHAKKFVWASVCCRPAKKCFSDGTNMHVSIHPREWWEALFAAHCGGKTFYIVETP